MAQAPIRWAAPAWADPIWWADQQIKVMTATATYLARVTQAFAGAATTTAITAGGSTAGYSEKLSGETGAAGQAGPATTLELARPAGTVPALAETPPIAAAEEVLPAVADAPPVPAVADAPPVPAVVDALPVPAAEIVPGETVTGEAVNGEAVNGEAGPSPAGELPVAHWDELSLGSIRARLGRLSEADLVRLHHYEGEHAGRPAVLTMLANRLAKVRAAGNPGGDAGT